MCENIKRPIVLNNGEAKTEEKASVNEGEKTE
jgi:phospholipid transport system substrate-binding protein